LREKYDELEGAAKFDNLISQFNTAREQADKLKAQLIVLRRAALEPLNEKVNALSKTDNVLFTGGTKNDDKAKGIVDLVNTINPILFIDFEMNMQDYQPIDNFEQEIIETGMVLTDQSGAIMKLKHWYIKPTLFPRLTKRTMKFLNYTSYEMNKAVTFKQFYNVYKQIVKEYNPYVIVWGKSDITTLKKTCQINRCPDLKLNFVNLLQLHTNYFNLKNSPGLFSMWESYTNTKLPEQRHNSLEDALVTKDVFFKFKEHISK
jgi:sporulation inhibitor KapD